MISQLYAFVRRDFAIAKSYRFQFLLGSVGIFFRLAMFYFLGRFIDDAAPNVIGGDHGYFAFVVFGLALLNWLSTALLSFATTLRTEQMTGSLEALLATPPSAAMVLISTSAYSFIQATITAALYIAVAVIVFGLRFTPNPMAIVTALYALVASLLLFSAVGVVLAAVTLVFKRANTLIGLATSGLSVLGGVYFPISVLPDPIRVIANLLPFTWALDVLRSSLLQGDVDWRRMGLLAVSNVILIPAALWTLDKAVTQARRAGSLTQY